MTIAAVASQAGGVSVASVTSVSRAFPVNVTAGGLVVVVAQAYTVLTNDPFVEGDCTQSAGTATLGPIKLGRARNDLLDVDEYQAVGIWSAIVTGSGSCTMQVAGMPTGSFPMIATDEYTGNWDASRLETGNSNGSDTDNATPAVTGNGTSAGGALFLSGLSVINPSAVTVTPQAAWTTIFEEENGASFSVGSAIRQIVTTGTTDEGEWALGPHLGYTSALAVYREAVVIISPMFYPKLVVLDV